MNISVLTFSRSWTKKGFQSGAIRSVKERSKDAGCRETDSLFHPPVARIPLYQFELLVKGRAGRNHEIVT